MASPFDISVVLAEAIENPELGPALQAIERSCAGILAEVLVVRPKGRPVMPRSATMTVREVIADESTLVPERWGLGVRAEQAPIFACLTTELTVGPDWARMLLEALDSGAAGAGGAIALVPRAGITATAVYLARFSAFLSRPNGEPSLADNIPGDAAAYSRNAVLAFPDLLAEGFWEAEFHARFRARGSRLAFIEQPLSSFDSSVRLRSALVLRARHGYGFGVARVLRHHESPIRLLLGAPAVPVILISRIVERAARSPGKLWLVIKVLPALALLCAAWACGEGVGAWTSRGRR